MSLRGCQNFDPKLVVETFNLSWQLNEISSHKAIYANKSSCKNYFMYKLKTMIFFFCTNANVFYFTFFCSVDFKIPIDYLQIILR